MHCPTMILNDVPKEYESNVKYFGFMLTSDSKDDVDMQRQLRTFYTRSNIILRQYYMPYVMIFVEDCVLLIIGNIYGLI